MSGSFRPRSFALLSVSQLFLAAVVVLQLCLLVVILLDGSSARSTTSHGSSDTKKISGSSADPKKKLQHQSKEELQHPQITKNLPFPISSVPRSVVFGKFQSLLAKLIREAEFLQNSRPAKIPNETRAATIVKQYLESVIEEVEDASRESGVGEESSKELQKKLLTIELIEYTEGRANLKVVYRGGTSSSNNMGGEDDGDANSDQKYLGLIGAHFDVVPANATTWKKSQPFELKVDAIGPFVPAQERDPETHKDLDYRLYGRGTADCLGHVALVTIFLEYLVRSQFPLNVVVVFIAAEEGGELGIGADRLLQDGKLRELQQVDKANASREDEDGEAGGGAAFWVDSGESRPVVGTVSTLIWELTAVGHLFHSGFPDKGINALELGSEAVRELQNRFYQKYNSVMAPENGVAEAEKKWNFPLSSTMKPTCVRCNEGSLNQIPYRCTFSGDIRATPFWDLPLLRADIETWVRELNSGLDERLAKRGPYSNFEIITLENKIKGRLEFRWQGQQDEDLPEDTSKQNGANTTYTKKIEDSVGDALAQPGALFEGIACSLNSTGHRALSQAVHATLGAEKAVPVSMNGGLPLVRSLQTRGIDLQMIGFARLEALHVDDEYIVWSEYWNGLRIFEQLALVLASQWRSLAGSRESGTSQSDSTPTAHKSGGTRTRTDL